MATKKKTTVQELQELIEVTPKANILTKEQLQTLEEIHETLREVRLNLGDLEGEDNVSKIMFQVGLVYNNVDWCEDELRDIINSYDEDYCDECDDNY